MREHVLRNQRVYATSFETLWDGYVERVLGFECENIDAARHSDFIHLKDDVIAWFLALGVPVTWQWRAIGNSMRRHMLASWCASLLFD